MRHLILLPFFIGLPGCLVYGNSPPAKATAAEGAFAGECHNGEDDDGDRLVDCRDDDCFEASNCLGHVVDSGADTGDDTAYDTAADTAGDTALDTGADTAAEAARRAPDPAANDEEHSPLGAAAQLGAGALLVVLAGRAARKG